jgi:hypothetical protein
VADFVDKEYREKAKASTCYSKKSGCFLPQYGELFTPAFKKEYKDKLSYFELTEEFHKKNDIPKTYIVHLLKALF